MSVYVFKIYTHSSLMKFYKAISKKEIEWCQVHSKLIRKITNLITFLENELFSTSINKSYKFAKILINLKSLEYLITELRQCYLFDDPVAILSYSTIVNLCDTIEECKRYFEQELLYNLDKILFENESFILEVMDYIKVRHEERKKVIETKISKLEYLYTNYPRVEYTLNLLINFINEILENVNIDKEYIFSRLVDVKSDILKIIKEESNNDLKNYIKFLLYLIEDYMILSVVYKEWYPYMEAQIKNI